MDNFRRRKHWLALLAIVFIFAGCKGESPTAPPAGGGNPPIGGGGGGNPPAGSAVEVTISASDTNPFLDVSSVISVRVTQGGQPVPNGTAVELSTTHGTFADTGQSVTIRTTTNGVATATLSAGSTGPAVVTAVVGNVLRNITITFRSRPVVEPQPNRDPVVSSITPQFVRPAGGETVRIQGRNFRGRVRVFFDVPGQNPVEGFVTSVTETEIQVTTPAVQLTPGQTLTVPVRVIVDADSPAPFTLTSPTPLTYQTQQLTPNIVTVSPSSGNVGGGTQVVIFGNGFQAPVQVLFGQAEAQVINVAFDQISVITPPSRSTGQAGNEPVVGPVDVTVVNINSGTRASLVGAFAYTPGMAITAVGPNQGPTTGGTRVTIDGIGFEGPVAVTLAGVAAQPIFVSSTRLIVESSPAAVTGCTDIVGPVVVTNINTGVSATGPQYIYRVQRPLIVSVTPATGTTIGLGSSINVRVANAGPFPRLTLGGRGVSISGATTNPDGTTTLTVAVPTTLQLQTQACPSGGTRQIATAFDVVFTNAESTCTTTLAGGLTVTPDPLGAMTITPNPLTLTARAADASATPPVVAQTGNGFFTVVNTGAAPLTITSVTSNNPQFQVTSDPSGTTLAPCESTIVGVRYPPEARGATSSAQITVTATTGTPAQTITARGTVIGTTQ